MDWMRGLQPQSRCPKWERRQRRDEGWPSAVDGGPGTEFGGHEKKTRIRFVVLALQTREILRKFDSRLVSFRLKINVSAISGDTWNC